MRAQRRSVPAVAVILLALAILTMGCSSGKKGTTAKGGPSATPGVSSASTSPAGGNGGGSFCAALKGQLAGLSAAFPTDLSDVEQLKRYGRFVQSSNAALAAAAPPEIAADVRLVARVSGAAADSYIRGVQPTGADLAALRAADFRAAAGRLSAYGRTRCGINPSALPR